jgi:hypothetical protein
MADVRLTRAEYWLLNLVVEAACPIGFLDVDDPVALFNKTGHGLDRKRLIPVIVDMLNQRWIEAGRMLESTKWGTLAPAAIVAALDEPPPRQGTSRTCYRLTPTGGAIWEAFAAPAWSDFIQFRQGEEAIIVGATESRVRRYLELLPGDGIVPISETVRWEHFSPWKATYWKTLESGCEVRFDFTTESPPSDSEQARSRLATLSRWYDWE